MRHIEQGYIVSELEKETVEVARMGDSERYLLTLTKKINGQQRLVWTTEDQLRELVADITALLDKRTVVVICVCGAVMHSAECKLRPHLRGPKAT